MEVTRILQMPMILLPTHCQTENVYGQPAFEKNRAASRVNFHEAKFVACFVVSYPSNGRKLNIYSENFPKEKQRTLTM